MYSFGLSLFGILTINPSLCVADNSLISKPSLSGLTTKYPSCSKIISIISYAIFHAFLFIDNYLEFGGKRRNKYAHEQNKHIGRLMNK